MKYNMYVLISDVCCPQLYICGYESILWCLMDSTSTAWTKLYKATELDVIFSHCPCCDHLLAPLTLSRLMTLETANITNTSKMIVIVYVGEEGPYTSYSWIPVSQWFLYMTIYRCVFLTA